MAARTGIGVGMGVTVTLLSLATLGLFVVCFIFLGEKQKAQTALADYQNQARSVIKDTERNDDKISPLIGEANASGGKSLAGYLKDTLATVSSKVAGGSPKMPKDLLTAIDGALGTSTSLLGAMGERDAKIAQLEKEMKAADDARKDALGKLQEQTDIVKRLEESHKKATDGVTAGVKTYGDEVEKNRTEVEKRVKEVEALVQKAKNDAAAEIVALTDRLAKLNDEYLIAQNKIKVLQEALGRNRLRPTDESALVDGQVVGLDSASTDVYINRGRKHKVVLGMTFAVYADAGAIRIDERTGDYSSGKATVEVIKVDDTSSTGRVIRQLRGNPIGRGDVIANAIYDPEKRYVFRVFGNFDADGDARSTPEEGAQIRAMIEAWGGKIVENLAGDVDFLVLGERPVLPPQPRADAGVGAMQIYLTQKRVVEDYDRLFDQAATTSIPVLNQNRLKTLIGR